MKRSMLFTPGNDAKNVMSAGWLPSDRIIFDLEDSVSVREKDAARILVRNAIGAMRFPKEVVVRLNALSSPFWRQDVETLLAAGPDFFMLPKIGCAEDIQAYERHIDRTAETMTPPPKDVKLIAILESAQGIENAGAIARSSPRMAAIMLGAEDLAGDIRGVRTPSGEEIAYARGRIVIAAKAAGIDAYDTPWTRIEDIEGLEKDAMLARRMGFTGKAAIHPGHVGVINRVFRPSAEEIEHAKGVLGAIAEAREKNLGVVSYKGEMVDAPVEIMARHILEMAEGGADV